jgi:hypothetical protein
VGFAPRPNSGGSKGGAATANATVMNGGVHLLQHRRNGGTGAIFFPGLRRRGYRSIITFSMILRWHRPFSRTISLRCTCLPESTKKIPAQVGTKRPKKNPLRGSPRLGDQSSPGRGAKLLTPALKLWTLYRFLVAAHAALSGLSAALDGARFALIDAPGGVRFDLSDAPGDARCRSA